MVRISQARRAMLTIYFVVGIANIAWVPRMPEIKSHLGVSAGSFGFLTAFGSIGALLSSFIASRLIHQFGSRNSVAFFGYSSLALMTAIPWIYHGSVYGVAMLVYGASVNGLSTALNMQSLHIEERRGTPSLSSFHGTWAAGALLTSVVSTLIVDIVPIRVHITVVALLTSIVLTVCLSRLITQREEGSDGDEIANLGQLLRPSRTAVLISIGLAGGAFSEYASGDWSAIYVRETLGTSLSRAAFTFTFIMLAITTSRLAGDRLILAYGPKRVIQSAGSAVIGGLALVSIAGHISDGNGSTIAVMLTYTGFALTGLGSGLMFPTFISASTNIQAPRAIALGQIILIQQALIWLLKAVMAFAVDLVGLENAILLPALVAIVAIRLASLTEKPQRAVLRQEQ